MKARLALLDRRLAVEADAGGVKELFQQIGQLVEVFEADLACGACGSTDIRPTCRTVEGYDY